MFFSSFVHKRQSEKRKTFSLVRQCECWWCLAINKIMWLLTRTAPNGFLAFIVFLLMYPSIVCTVKGRFRRNFSRIGRRWDGREGNAGQQMQNRLSCHKSSLLFVLHSWSWIYIDWKWSAVIIIPNVLIRIIKSLTLIGLRRLFFSTRLPSLFF